MPVDQAAECSPFDDARRECATDEPKSAQVLAYREKFRAENPRLEDRLAEKQARAFLKPFGNRGVGMNALCKLPRR